MKAKKQKSPKGLPLNLITKKNISPTNDNVNYLPQSDDIVEHAWTLTIPQLRGLIREVREYGYSKLAAQLDLIIDEKIGWGTR